MNNRCRYLHLDVFTGEKFGGNQLAVFVDARGLSTETMQAATREMNFSESTFILPAERPDTDIRMRIFTPGREMPMAGHPTVGSTFALALAGVIPAGRRRWTFGLNIGPTPVDIDWDGGRATFAWMTQQRPVFGPAVADVQAAARAIGLDAAAVRATGLPVQEVSCGVPFVFIPLATRAQVDAASPHLEVFDRMCGAAGVDNHAMFVFSREPGPDRATVYSRMFAPGLGVHEDPATGSASGPLGCYLVKHGVVLPEQAGAILSLQGVKMGRPSRVHIAIGLDGGDIARVQVGGEAVLVGEGELFL
jgi:trans-2,3-dihydro-3-hydroxyanthranilate isomerase